MRDVLGFILGGGRGAGLYPLTKFRSPPAVMIGGQYRLIDVPISNCINSGLRRVHVLTQFLSVSLHRHIANTYKFAPFSRGYIDVLPAQQTNEAADWYQGTADALRQNSRYLTAGDDRHVLILSGDGLYRMNYADLLDTHERTQADLTIAVQPVSGAAASRLGIVRLDESDRMVELVEKPQSPALIESLRTPAAWLRARGVPPGGPEHLANMGVYLFRREVLLGLLRDRPQAVDLVTQLIADSLTSLRVQAHVFAGYWQDLGTIAAYHEANLGLASDSPPFDFHSPDGVIYTHGRNLPASQVRAAHISQTLVSEGVHVGGGSRLDACVLGLRATVGRDVVMEQSVVNGADRYETPAQQAASRAAGTPAVGVGDGCIIRRAILDKGCRVGEKVRLVNAAGVREAEGDNYVIRDGLIIIPRGAVVPDGTTI